MAVFIEAQYQKRIGLPSFSSHSYAVTVRSEVSDFSEVEKESAKLFAILQGTVDREIQEVGFTPVPLSAGSSPEPRTNGHGTDQPRGNGQTKTNGDQQWSCSDRQKELILRIIEENKLDKRDVENLAKELFNTPVLTLNKLQASGLIEHLLQTYGDSKPKGNGNGRRQYQRGGARQ